MISLNQMVEFARRFEGTERDQLIEALCAGNAERGNLVRRMAAVYQPPTVSWPPASLPCQVGHFKLLQELSDPREKERKVRVYLAERLSRPEKGEIPVRNERAVKFFEPERSEQSVSRVEEEANKAWEVNSPDIVRVFSAGRMAGAPLYIEMEAVVVRQDSEVTAHTLNRPDADISMTEAVRLVERVARAVASAHARGVIHGDIKPANVLIARQGKEPRRVKLADFGIARAVRGVSDVSPPRTGTPAYMAPEQWCRTGRRDPDERSDVYGLGGILYQLLSGRPPHANRDPTLDGDDDPPLTPLGPDVPARLRDIVHKALSRDRNARHASALEFADDLRRYREHYPTSLERQRPFRRAGLWLTRHRREVITAATLALVGGFAIALLTARIDSLRGEKADLERQKQSIASEVAQLDSMRQSVARERDGIADELKKVAEELRLKEEELKKLARKWDHLNDVFTKSYGLLSQELKAGWKSHAGEFSAVLADLEAQRTKDLIEAGKCQGALAAASEMVARLNSELVLAAENRETVINARAAAALGAFADELKRAGAAQAAVERTLATVREELRVTKEQCGPRPAPEDAGSAAPAALPTPDPAPKPAASEAEAPPRPPT